MFIKYREHFIQIINMLLEIWGVYENVIQVYQHALIQKIK